VGGLLVLLVRVRCVITQEQVLNINPIFRLLMFPVLIVCSYSYSFLSTGGISRIIFWLRNQRFVAIIRGLLFLILIVISRVLISYKRTARRL